jgi:tetratricopeptide (TPR) repeat protein
VYDWLRNKRNGKWLLVLDNVDDPDYLFRTPDVSDRSGSNKGALRNRIAYLPPCEHGSTLITSRSRVDTARLTDECDIITINPMEESTALALLERKLGHSSATEDMQKLAAALDHMPLALAQAGAYIKQRGSRYSVERYLARLEKSEKSQTSLLTSVSKELRRDEEAQDSIILTWQISFDHVRATRPSAADLLSLMSMYNHQGIPESLLKAGGGDTRVGARPTSGSDGVEHDSDTSSSASDDEDSEMDDFEDDILTLENFGFISIMFSNKAFEMHRLVQLAVRAWLRSRDALVPWRDQSIHKLAEVFPKPDYQEWGTCSSLFPHAFLSIKHRPDGVDLLKKWGVMLQRAGLYIVQQGQTKTAEKIFIAVERVYSDQFGSDAVVTLACTTNIANIYWMQGRWQEAEELELLAIKLKSKVFGRSHPQTLINTTQLSAQWEEQGRWKEVESMENLILEDMILDLGNEHLETLSRKSELASIYERHGSWEQSLRLRREVAVARLQKSGREDDLTLDSLVALAACLKSQNMWRENERQEEEILDIGRKKYGNNHAFVLNTMARLALTFKMQGKWKDAEKLEKQVLAKRKTSLGEADPTTMEAMAELAQTHLRQAQWSEAEELLIPLVQVKERTLGNENVLTLGSMTDLADTFGYLGRWTESEELHTRVMETRRKIFGGDHPDTKKSISRLITAYQTQGRGYKVKELQDIDEKAPSSVPLSRFIAWEG